MSQVYKTPQAQRDLVAIGYYLAEHSPVASERFLREAERAFRLLTQMPEIGSTCSFRSPRLRDVRFWTLRRFKNYVIYYRPVSGGVEIIRVLHGVRDAERHLRR
jgi:toxin ParE1/3/4